ncbi:hypothetical protein [Psychrobacillus psychrodurans]|uniref:hypothetical protein n=1 Tax=Psychrobacillus psychrodurans TaxID=126157 RepID=UPI0008E79D19|nr:hypothetical protein [Psychrobacillus psychrodurans]MCZ8542225.1 hypothetical protein [Psychrobacillus psychrodurans]SFN28476.1 hypothetical protein SAMN05421832_13311 [Psychrobacillus psychrodurans]
MSQNKRDKIQMQKKVQGLYRKKKKQRREDMDHMNEYSDMDDLVDNKIAIIILRICVVLAIILLVLNAFIKDF